MKGGVMEGGGPSHRPYTNWFPQGREDLQNVRDSTQRHKLLSQPRTLFRIEEQIIESVTQHRTIKQTQDYQKRMSLS